MTTHPEVVRLNLKYYRKQAKALLKAAKLGDPAALKRLVTPTPALHDAQFVIAREQGFSNWPRFKAFIIDSNLDFQQLTDAFIGAAVSNGKRAEEMLQAHPALAHAGFYVALVLGYAAAVEHAIEHQPELLNAKTGPQHCEPLLYVCFSRFANPKSSYSAGLTETVRVLLRHGANPNPFYLFENRADMPLSCLYGATGLNNNVEMGRALLDAGANPNDNESLYHSLEHPDLACTRLLLERGATALGTNALKHVLDREEIEGLKLLLAAGADPNETNDRGETALHWAVWRGRSEEIARLLVAGGANLNTKRNDGRTAYALAAISGQTQIAELLRKRGANTELQTLDQFIASRIASANHGPAPVSMPSGQERLLSDLTQGHHTRSVSALLDAGTLIDARGEAGGTALHWACWKGYADLVKLLIDRGAPLTVLDTEFHATPAGWFHHGTSNSPDGGAHAEVARLLIAANAPMEGCNTPTGNAEVDAILREHKLIE